MAKYIYRLKFGDIPLTVEFYDSFRGIIAKYIYRLKFDDIPLTVSSRFL